MPRRLLARPGLKSKPPPPIPPPPSSAPLQPPACLPITAQTHSLRDDTFLHSGGKPPYLSSASLLPPHSVERAPSSGPNPLADIVDVSLPSSSLSFLIPIILKQFMARSFLSFFSSSSSSSSCLYTFLIMPSKMLVGDIFTPIPCLPLFSCRSSFLVCFFPFSLPYTFLESRSFSLDLIFSLFFL